MKELSVGEQRYKAVMAVLSGGRTVTEVEGIAEADDGPSERRLLGPVRDVIDERSIDLEHIDRGPSFP
jgi:hypothetical protein